jgi:hypothetical protein
MGRVQIDIFSFCIIIINNPENIFKKIPFRMKGKNSATNLIKEA